MAPAVDPSSVASGWSRVAAGATAAMSSMAPVVDPSSVASGSSPRQPQRRQAWPELTRLKRDNKMEEHQLQVPHHLPAIRATRTML
jgi:hypothetical protein